MEQLIQIQNCYYLVNNLHFPISVSKAARNFYDPNRSTLQEVKEHLKHHLDKAVDLHLLTKRGSTYFKVPNFMNRSLVAEKSEENQSDVVAMQDYLWNSAENRLITYKTIPTDEPFVYDGPNEFEMVD